MEVSEIEYEVIVQYNGDILNIKEVLDIDIEILSSSYAIIITKDEKIIDELLNFPQIQYIEKPFNLQTQDMQSFSSSGITKFKNTTNLTGKGTLLGIIDSGIDYNLPIFKDEDGNSKILYYWDQSINGTPPDGFKYGSLYTNEDINKAINQEMFIPVSSTSSHGTHVASISAQIANEANLIVVRVGRRQTDIFSKSSEFMRAIKFILDKSIELNMPVAINISYGSNEGSHRGLSLFEQYIDDMCLYGKNNIVVASGNNANKGAHQNIQIDNKEEKKIEFVVGESERVLNINIWPSFIDDISISLSSPSNKTTQEISINNQEINTTLDNTRIEGFFYDIAPYSLSRRISINLSSNSQIDFGIWSINITGNNIVVGDMDIYLPTSEGLSLDTKFLNPTKELTTTVPGTSSRVITVGSYNSRTDIVSVFSGQGDTKRCINKPDLLAPGEDIVAFLPGGTTGALTGTSMATPHVTGCCSLLMQWGIVNKNDLFLYSQKLKSVLLENAVRNQNESYPSNSKGYGLLSLDNLNLSNNSLNNDIYREPQNRSKDISPGINIYHNGGFEKELEESGIDYDYKKISDKFGVLFITNQNYNDIVKILGFKSIITTESTIRMSLLGEVSQGTSGGVVATEDIDSKFFSENPNLDLTGRGVLIAIIDTGIDYLHKDFIYANGESKVLYLWDQTKEENPPDGYYIGEEFDNNQINEAIKNNDNTLSVDEVGHGTGISGICAGLGNVNLDYEGVVKDSDLIVVKVGTIDGYYNNAMIFAGVEYAYKKAVELNRPLVVNLGFGSSNMAGVTSRTATQSGFYTKGLCIVTGAGNQGNTEIHTSGQIDFKNQSKVVEFELMDDEEEVEIQLWVNRPDKIDLSIISPTGEESKTADVTNYDQITGRFDLEGTDYLISFVYPTTFSGQQNTSILLSNVKKGTWKIKLTGIYITTGKYNLYLPNRQFIKPGTKFINPDPDKTINYPGVYNDVITVGAYNSISNSLWQESSRGFTINNILKPDLVAPGVNIIAPYPGNKYAKITGTSAASAHVCGAVSIYYQYVLVDENYPDKAFLQKVRTYMQGGASREEDVSYPNNRFGYGLLNVRGMFNQLK